MNTPLVTALAAALFHFMWEGAALALLLALRARRLSRIENPLCLRLRGAPRHAGSLL